MPTRIRLYRSDWLNQDLFPARMINKVPSTGNIAQAPWKRVSWSIKNKLVINSIKPKKESPCLIHLYFSNWALIGFNPTKFACVNKANTLPDRSSHMRVKGKKNVADANFSTIDRFKNKEAHKRMEVIRIAFNLYLNTKHNVKGQNK